MPIDIDPTPARRVVASEQTFAANALWCDDLDIDASKRDYGMIGATVKATPYHRADDGTPLVFASAPTIFRTSNLVAAMTRIPEMAAAFVAVQVGIAAWHRYTQARAADLMAVQSALADAQAAEATAKTTLDAAATARTAAYAARTGVDDPSWIAADQAWQTTVTAHADAQAATGAAQATVTQAQLAFDDAANPPAPQAQQGAQG